MTTMTMATSTTTCVRMCRTGTGRRDLPQPPFTPTGGAVSDAGMRKRSTYDRAGTCSANVLRACLNPS